MDLESDEKVIEFFLERESKPGTQKKYLIHLRHYIEHAGDGLTPTELIQEAISEERLRAALEEINQQQKVISDLSNRGFVDYITGRLPESYKQLSEPKN